MKRKKIVQYILCVIVCVAPAHVFAASYSFSGDAYVAVGSQRSINVFINTNGEFVNAIEGTVRILGEDAHIVDVYTGGSILSFWLNDVERNEREVPFVGIIPGGFSGTGFIMSVVVEGAGIGSAELVFDDLRTLLHDGKGTETVSTSETAEIIVQEELTGDPTLYTDTLPPEWFEPAIIQSVDVFNNQYALVFAAQDKGFGISHYEVQESRDGELHINEWKEAQSPYLLQDQRRRSTIFVKAVDRAGNARIVAISEAEFTRAVWLYWMLPLMAIVVFILGIMAHRRHIRKDATLEIYGRGEEQEK